MLLQQLFAFCNKQILAVITNRGESAPPSSPSPSLGPHLLLTFLPHIISSLRPLTSRSFFTLPVSTFSHCLITAFHWVCPIIGHKISQPLILHLQIPLCLVFCCSPPSFLLGILSSPSLHFRSASLQRFFSSEKGEMNQLQNGKLQRKQDCR